MVTRGAVREIYVPRGGGEQNCLLRVVKLYSAEINRKLFFGRFTARTKREHRTLLNAKTDNSDFEDTSVHDTGENIDNCLNNVRDNLLETTGYLTFDFFFI